MSRKRSIAPEFFKAGGRVWRRVGTPWDAGGCVGRVVMARPVRPLPVNGDFAFAGDQEAIRLADAFDLLSGEAAWQEAVRLEKAADLLAARTGAA